MRSSSGSRSPARARYDGRERQRARGSEARSRQARQLRAARGHAAARARHRAGGSDPSRRRARHGTHGGRRPPHADLRDQALRGALLERADLWKAAAERAAAS